MQREIASLVVVASVALGGCSDAVGSEGRSLIGRRLQEVRATARVHDYARQEGLVAARGKFVPGLGRCPVGFPAPPEQDPRERPAPVERIEIVSVPEISWRKGPTHVDVFRGIPNEEETLFTRLNLQRDTEKAVADFLSQLDRLASAATWTHDITVVGTELRRPESRGPSFFEPGFVDGEAYVWSYAEKRVVCVAHVVARSSSPIRFRTSLIGPLDERDALENDFERQAMRALRPRLYEARRLGE